MTDAVEKLLEAAYALTPDERMALAEVLFASVYTPTDAEQDRRIAAIHAGEAPPWPEVRARILAKYDR